jgi:hypothetical protein
MSAFRGKADMTSCGNPLSRSLFGVKRTSLFAAQMSAFDPKRTFTVQRVLRSQQQNLEFLAGGSVSTKLIDRHGHWRERERLERFGEHLFQIGFGGDTGRDVRIEFLASRDLHKTGHIVDQEPLNVAAFLGAHERCGGSGFHSKRRNRVDYFLLQPEQVWCRLDYNPRNADWRRWDVMVFDCLQFPACWPLVS